MEHTSREVPRALHGHLSMWEEEVEALQSISERDRLSIAVRGTTCTQQNWHMAPLQGKMCVRVGGWAGTFPLQHLGTCLTAKAWCLHHSEQGGSVTSASIHFIEERTYCNGLQLFQNSLGNPFDRGRTYCKWVGSHPWNCTGVVF